MSSQALVTRDLQGFFHELVRKAMTAQAVRSSEDSEFYLVALLERFAHPRRDWFERPLALDFLESFHASGSDRYMKLKHVADTSLFLTGIFMETLERTTVGCNYYVSLGRVAYGHLAGAAGGRAAAHPFAELSARFREFVRVLSEISFEQLFRDQRHLLRIYTRWLCTRSERDRQWLIRRGLIPLAGCDRTRH